MNQQIFACLIGERIQARLQRLQCGVRQDVLDRRFAHRADFCQPHAESGQYAGERMYHNLGHAEHVGHAAGMLAARSAKTAHGITAYVVPAFNRDRFDRLRHIVHGNSEEAIGYGTGRHRGAGFAFDLFGKFGEGALDHVLIQRLVAIGTEYMREMRWLNASEHDVAIGHGQWPAFAITGRTGIGAGRFRADLEAAVFEAADRTASGCHSMNMHHRRAHAYAGHYGLEYAFIATVVMRHIGGSTAHVEADHLG